MWNRKATASVWPHSGSSMQDGPVSVKVGKWSLPEGYVRRRHYAWARVVAVSENSGTIEVCLGSCPAKDLTFPEPWHKCLVRKNEKGLVLFIKGKHMRKTAHPIPKGQYSGAVSDDTLRLTLSREMP